MRAMCICASKLSGQTEQHIIPFILSFNTASSHRLSAAQMMVRDELSAPVSDPSHYV